MYNKDLDSLHIEIIRLRFTANDISTYVFSHDDFA